MVETRGKGAFDLDGASEPYNRGAWHACLICDQCPAEESQEYLCATPFVDWR